ncbi:hypothetical protein SLV14_007398 [Streptomyces sp. Je 1-4]|uniref:hypothetical protein n=1 Tax=Streptomyces TaxID=1883 RepID=UPI002180B4E6|nr:MULTISPECIES: hypothetical protein [unclassified Streptomyces]UYB44316.1 hypothetical protein SLV14_007398 [Streptomyces sp. Je 1-4]UZQ40768.1 hypothetical protein SLV14N_007398 [Streptomyces sp. Je 1-4] [Streptomyces sp. Je 1-4 4N24]UZQ48185.1 hypothetical protein SLV14NA_007398 [Streptomyces sp. Je 1-4] [Streptomyces sp. Je 1-4 4N24_ara]
MDRNDLTGTRDRLKVGQTPVRRHLDSCPEHRAALDGGERENRVCGGPHSGFAGEYALIGIFAHEYAVIGIDARARHRAVEDPASGLCAPVKETVVREAARKGRVQRRHRAGARRLPRARVRNNAFPYAR